MAAVLRSTLVPLVRLRADMVNSAFVTDAEIKGLLDTSAKRLYDMILRESGEPPNANSVFLYTLSGSRYLQLPDDFCQLLGVYVQRDGVWFPMQPFALETVSRDLNAQAFGQSPALLSYRVVGFQYPQNPSEFGSNLPPGQMLELSPWPGDTPQYVMISYIPSVVNQATGGSDVYYEGYNGWEEWMVLRAAAFCLDKGKLDFSFLQAEMARIEQDIHALAGRRDAAQPAQIRDVTCGDYGGPFPPGRGGWWW